MLLDTYSLFIGRWQPFHGGHKALIDSVLAEGKNVLIAIRRTEQSEENPLSVSDRWVQIREVYPDEKTVQLISIPDIEEVCYGRGVGYGIREIRLGYDVESISGTKIRESWKDGNPVDNG